MSQSGSIGLVGAVNKGSVYLFRDMDTATGTVTENVKLTASDGSVGLFGYSIGLDGDNFIVGAFGKAYSGSVASVTTLDTGNTSKVISGISFVSQDDWIVGQTTDVNQVTLSVGDTANVTAAGKAIHIGRTLESTANTLLIEGNLTSNEVYIGSIDGNVDNVLQLENTATFASTAFRLAEDNLLKIEGDYTNIDNLLTYLGSTKLQTWTGTAWEDITAVNYTDRITQTQSGGYTNIEAIPEPGTYALMLVAAGGFLLLRRRKNKAALI